MAAALASTILVGCVEDDRLIDPTPPAEAPSGSGWTAANLPADSIFADEPMLELAREIPTFAGFYYDENDPERMVVALTDVADLGRAESRIRDVLRADRRPAGAVPTTAFVARQVEYPFLELAGYRTVLRGHVFDIPGVVSLGVNESDNRVKVGVVDGSAETAVRELLAELEIPEEVVIFPRTGYPELGSHTLRDPTPGGTIQGAWEISTLHPFDPSRRRRCSLGFAVRRASDGLEGFLTNSHCTTKVAEYDGNPFRQPLEGQLIGYEEDDPPTFLCPTGSYPYCREADVALIEATVPLDFEKIGRTTASCGLENCPEVVTVDHTLPTFTIVDRYDHVIENETVHKVGRTTGWTYGAVEDTCDDVVGRIVKILCSDRVDYASDGGDSGSPVFQLLPSGNVELRGIHWGGCDGCPLGYDDGWMSDLNQIEKDLGPLIVLNVRASIMGPGEVPPNTTCTWQASVVGGREPYFYTWRIGFNVVGTGSQVFLDTGTQDFQLILEVVDADQGYSYDQKSIDVDPGADPGLFCF